VTRRPRARSSAASVPHRAEAASSNEPSAAAPRGAALRFLLVFALGMTAFEVYWSTLTPDAGFWRGGYFQHYLEWNARVSARLLGWLGYDAQTSGTSIFAPEGAVDVRRGCDGVQPSVLFAIAVLAFPAPWRLRLLGAALGVALLLALNLARIVTLFLLRVHAPGVFDEAHHWIWPMAFVVTALSLWVAWARRVLPAPGLTRG
jgi:exosortase/archaeosortase family protein